MKGSFINMDVTKGSFIAPGEPWGPVGGFPDAGPLPVLYS
jgi:hypothetical protein